MGHIWSLPAIIYTDPMLKPAPNITDADNPIKTVPKLLWTRKSPESPQMCSLFFKALISNDTDTEAPTEGAAKTFSEARLQIQRWPQSVFTDIVIATNPVQHHPVLPALGPLRVHLPSSPLAHTNEVTRAWIALVEWFLCFFHMCGSSWVKAVGNM